MSSQIRSHRFIEDDPNAIQLKFTNEFPADMLQEVAIESVKKRLAMDLDANARLFIAWNKAERMLNSNSNPDIENLLKAYPRECIIAAMSYTLETPSIYTDFNQQTREYKRTKSYPYKALFWLLGEMRKVDQTLVHNNSALYRGCSVPFTAEIGNNVTLGNYTSTTIDPKVAEQFTAESQPSTLFKFTNVISFLSLEPISAYPDEKEYLLFPFESFTVKDIIKINDKLTKITLESNQQTVLAKEPLTVFQRIAPWEFCN